VAPEEVQRLLAHSGAAGDRSHALWCFLANSGLRIGEALALRWSSVDLEAGWFTVEEDLDPGGRPDGPKTEAGLREVPLTEAAVAALRARRARQDEERRRLGEGYADHGLVFPTATGRPNGERNALRSLKASRRAGVSPDLAPHDFRRVCASLLVASGVDIVTAAAILGHRRASVLLDVYARALREPKRAAAVRLQALLYPADGAERASPLPRRTDRLTPRDPA
jgi:integrase